MWCIKFWYIKVWSNKKSSIWNCLQLLSFHLGFISHENSISSLCINLSLFSFIIYMMFSSVIDFWKLTCVFNFFRLLSLHSWNIHYWSIPRWWNQESERMRKMMRGKRMIERETCFNRWKRARSRNCINIRLSGSFYSVKLTRKWWWWTKRW